MSVDNLIRKLNKRMTDATKYGSSNVYTQRLANAMMQANAQIAAELAKQGIATTISTNGFKMGKGTVTLKITTVQVGASNVPVVKMVRSKLLGKIDQNKLDAILKQVENIGTFGEYVKKIKEKIENEGIEPTPNNIKIQMMRDYNATMGLLDRIRELYDYFADNPDDPLADTFNILYDLGFSLGQAGAGEYMDRFAELYDRWKIRQEGLDYEDDDASDLLDDLL